MIIYFSGTGNSLYVAKKLLSESERLVSIADCMKQNDFSIELEKDENLGFVFPVYFLPFLLSSGSLLKKRRLEMPDMYTA